MADWFSGWLKQIVLIVMLAAFADLLLPNNAMQRYVKTVMALIILLTLLDPLFSLVRHDWNVSGLLASAEKWATEGPAGSKADGNRLPSIMRDGEKLRQTNLAQAERLSEQRLAEEIRENVERVFGVKLEDVKVRLALDREDNPRIEHVTVTVASDAEPVRDDRNGAQPVKPIEPVRIDIRIGEAMEVSAPPQTAVTPEQTELGRQIGDLIKRQWSLGDEQITIAFASETGK